MSDTYKPTEHGGLREDGKPDQRVGTGEFAHGKVDPTQAGHQGGKTSGTSQNYHEGDTSGNSHSNKGTGNGGSSAKGEFAHGKVDPHEAGRKGGKKSSTGDDNEDD
ncbi:hypothetical protein G7Z17_g5992 [Cylindrodendrum hubeiense]|uniref:Uncharacterized protein n=1 Tax=Cylindrodendrum hubeiense TaxID=595255 RepID=A0A9P5H814_9HYPO|nr:hypothetical protein G7Z17_g5992 [Cylindrodendrum hubeiense]